MYKIRKACLRKTCTSTPGRRMHRVITVLEFRGGGSRRSSKNIEARRCKDGVITYRKSLAGSTRKILGTAALTNDTPTPHDNTNALPPVPMLPKQYFKMAALNDAMMDLQDFFLEKYGFY